MITRTTYARSVKLEYKEMHLAFFLYLDVRLEGKSFENLFMHLFLNWCTKEKRQNRGNTKTGWIKRNKMERKGMRGTHM